MLKFIFVLMIVSSAAAQVPSAKQFEVLDVPHATLLEDCIEREVDASQEEGSGIYEADAYEVEEYCQREVRGAQ